MQQKVEKKIFDLSFLKAVKADADYSNEAKLLIVKGFQDIFVSNLNFDDKDSTPETRKASVDGLTEIFSIPDLPADLRTKFMDQMNVFKALYPENNFTSAQWNEFFTKVFNDLAKEYETTTVQPKVAEKPKKRSKTPAPRKRSRSRPKELVVVNEGPTLNMGGCACGRR